MPYSSDEGKAWLVERIAALEPSSVLDIGPGAGTYATLLRPRLPTARFHGIEVHAPYIARFGLDRLYDEITVADIRSLNDFPLADVVILGDVLEHLRFDEAQDAWFRARGAARLGVFLSLPIVDYPQGECEGNAHEAHLETWSHERVLAGLGGIVAFETYSEIGVYQACPA